MSNVVPELGWNAVCQSFGVHDDVQRTWRLFEALSQTLKLYDPPPKGWALVECQMLDSSIMVTLIIIGDAYTLKDVPTHPISPRGLASDMSTVVGFLPFDAWRQEKIRRLEASGDLVSDCMGCSEFYAHPFIHPFAPAHRASAGCRSGRRNHCTCDTCF